MRLLLEHDGVQLAVVLPNDVEGLLVHHGDLLLGDAQDVSRSQELDGGSERCNFKIPPIVSKSKQSFTKVRERGRGLLLLTERVRVEADDEVDSVALDVADEGLVAARGHGHRLRDARELEPLEEADGEVAVGGRGMCYKIHIKCKFLIDNIFSEFLVY